MKKTIQFEGQEIEVMDFETYLDLGNITVNKQRTIKLLAGKHNKTNQVFYWELNENAKIGDYAIVENGTDYSMVKVIGILETSMKYQHHITKTNELKKVIKIIPRNEIRKD